MVRHVQVLAAVLTALAAAPVAGQGEAEAPRRGPATIHDEQLLAQPRLTLAALSPDTIGAGRWALRVSVLWSSSFSWTQDVPGETPQDRSFLIDGEAGTLDITLARGLTDRLDLALRLPMRWRGGGTLDRLIDGWHGIVGFPDGMRAQFRRNVFRVQGVTAGGARFSWDGETGWGLGNVEAGARFRLRDGGRDGWSLALSPRVSLPTGSGPFDGDGMAFAVQGVAARRLGHPFDLSFGAGAMAATGTGVQGVAYAPVRGHLFAAVEWRPGRRWSVVGETNVGTRLVDGIDRYPGLHWVANLTAFVDLPARSRFEIGFTENIKSQQSTTDFAFHLAVSVRP